MTHTTVVVRINATFWMPFEVFTLDGCDPKKVAAAHLAALSGRRLVTKEWSI